MSYWTALQTDRLNGQLEVVNLTIEMVKYIIEDSLRWNTEHSNSLPRHFKCHEDIHTILKGLPDALDYFSNWIFYELVQLKSQKPRDINDDLRILSGIAFGNMKKLYDQEKNKKDNNNGLRQFVIESSFNEKIDSYNNNIEKLRDFLNKSDFMDDVGQKSVLDESKVREDFYNRINSWYQFLSKAVDIQWKLLKIQSDIESKILPVQ